MKSLMMPEWRAFLRYEDLAGSGPANVYLAGLIWASQASFIPIVAQAPALAAFRSVFVDLFGTGFSDAPEEFGYSLQDHAATVTTLLDALNLKDCCLIGYSIGGAVAITLAAIRPDLVARLVLMEANLDPLGPGEGMVSTGVAAQTEEEFRARGFQALIDSFRHAGKEGDGTAATTAGILQVAAPHAVHRSAVALVQGTRPTMRERLLQMSIPRAYIFGDRSLPDPDWDILSSHGIQVLTVPNAGHGMAWDNPGGVARALVTALTT
jgi:pimeloyl-ACP methyl ester carboxylesterase